MDATWMDSYAHIEGQTGKGTAQPSPPSHPPSLPFLLPVPQNLTTDEARRCKRGHPGHPGHLGHHKTLHTHMSVPIFPRGSRSAIQLRLSRPVPGRIRRLPPFCSTYLSLFFFCFFGGGVLTHVIQTIYTYARHDVPTYAHRVQVLLSRRAGKTTKGPFEAPCNVVIATPPIIWGGVKMPGPASGPPNPRHGTRLPHGGGDGRPWGTTARDRPRGCSPAGRS